MRRKIVMIVAAVLCGIAGTALLVNFVRGAESRALEGEQLVTVFVAAERIPSGTPVSTMVTRGLVEQTQVPVKVRAPDAITALAQIDGKVGEAWEKWGQDKLQEAEQKLGEIEGKIRDGLDRDEITPEAAQELQAAIAQATSFISDR